MPVFEIETADGVFEVDAPDEGKALAALKPKGRGHSNVPEFAPVGRPNYDAKTGMVERPGNLIDTAGAFSRGVVEGVPIAGPTILKGLDAVTAGAASLVTGDGFSDTYDRLRGVGESVAAENPIASGVGNLTGAVAGTIPMMAAAPGAFGLGTGSWLARGAASGASGAAIGGADSAARGGSPGDIATSAAIGGGGGLVMPAVGDALGAGVKGLLDWARPAFNAVRKPTEEAARRVGTALNRDIAADPAQVMSATDEAVARSMRVPVMNVDRGGETTRALARSVANNSPEARSAIEKAAAERFATQGDRATEFVRKLAGGSVDDLAFQEAVQNAARAANKPAYGRAFASPRARGMWGPELEQLMGAPAIRKAATQATTRGANRATAEGFAPVTNPFEMANGKVSLRRNPDGSVASPNLAFWDQVKRNLDGQIGVAERAGDKTLAADITALKRKLTGTLDKAVPEYALARRGAATFFDAEDALEAGRKFARQPRSIPEAKRAHAGFSSAEKKAFSTGFASELIDSIKATRDGVNVVNKIFKSQAAREQIDLVFGAERAKALEAYLRVETLADRLRGAMGNSTTARQLMEMGLGAGGGYAIGGDWQSAAWGAVAAKGARVIGQRADAKMMKAIADLLTSDDPQALAKATAQAAKSPAFMKALETMGDMLGATVRGSTISSARPPEVRQGTPLEITVGRPAY